MARSTAIADPQWRDWLAADRPGISDGQIRPGRAAALRQIRTIPVQDRDRRGAT